jgi:hypothetical protein
MTKINSLCLTLLDFSCLLYDTIDKLVRRGHGVSDSVASAIIIYILKPCYDPWTTDMFHNLFIYLFFPFCIAFSCQCSVWVFVMHFLIPHTYPFLCYK